jgi:hypothetical protein
MPIHCGLLATTHVCVSTVGGGNGAWWIVQIRSDVAASWPSEFGGFFRPPNRCKGCTSV